MSRLLIRLIVTFCFGGPTCPSTAPIYVRSFAACGRVAAVLTAHAVAVGGCIVGAWLALRPTSGIPLAHRVPAPVLAQHAHPTPVPEPSGAALLAVAVVALGAARAIHWSRP